MNFMPSIPLNVFYNKDKELETAGYPNTSILLYSTCCPAT